MAKVCNKCGKRKLYSDFYKQKDHKDGLRSRCKICLRQENYNYRHSKEGQIKSRLKYQVKKNKLNSKDYFKDQYLWVNYRLRLKQHKQKYINQNGCCIICKQPVSYDNIYTDHNHSTNKVRDLLCPRCNTFVGYIENWPELIVPITKYLEKHNE